MDRDAVSIRRRLARFGLRVLCLACGAPGRHFPDSGRVRDARCRACGAQELRPTWWVDRYETRAREEVRRARGRVALFD